MTNVTNQGSARFEARVQQQQRCTRKNYLYAGLFLLLALIAGCAIGVGVTVMHYHKKRFRPPKPEVFTEVILGHMDKAVSLTPAERDQLRQRIFTSLKEAKRIRGESSQRVWREFSHLTDEVDTILGPERARIWNEDVKKRTGRDRREPPRYKGDKEEGDETESPGQSQPPAAPAGGALRPPGLSPAGGQSLRPDGSDPRPPAPPPAVSAPPPPVSGEKAADLRPPSP